MFSIISIFTLLLVSYALTFLMSCFIHTKIDYNKFAPDCPIGLASDRWKQWVLHSIFCSPIGQLEANKLVGMKHQPYRDTI